MRSRLVLVWLFATAAVAVAQTDEAPSLAIRVKRVWLGDDAGVAAATVIVEKGVVRALLPAGAATPAGMEVIDWSEGTAIPGLVLAHARGLAAATDVVEAETPTAVGADGFDPFVPRLRHTRAGITAAAIAPGQDRLITGLVSIVRPGVNPPAAWLALRESALRINLGEGPRRTPSEYKPPVLPGPEAPLPPAEAQFPKTRAGALAEIRSLFTRAAAAKAAPAAPAEGEIDLRPFIRALDGRLPVRIAADRRADIEAAIALAREFRFTLVIEGGAEAWRVASALGSVSASVVLRASLVPPTPEGTSPGFFHAEGEGNPAAPALLKAAGVAVALVPPGDSADENVLFHAGRAVRAGFSRGDALASVTSGAARILGIADVAGTIAVGRTADLLVFAGDPFESAAQPVLVLAAGRVTRRAPKRDDLVAITVGRIHTCDGDVLENATIVVEKGKIRAIGRNVTVPADARRIVNMSAVVVPGFVDGGGQAGLRGVVNAGDDALTPPQPIGSLGLEQPIVRYFDGDLPTLAGAARAGVTTIGLSPGPGRLISGGIATVKTHGAVGASRVLRQTSGILFDLSGITPNDAGQRQIAGMLESGKKYADSFPAYDTAFAEWEKTKKPAAAAPEATRVVGAVTAPKVRDPITGTWHATARSPVLPAPMAFTLVMTLEGTHVTGSATSPRRPEQKHDIDGQFSGGHFTTTLDMGRMKIEVDATVGRDSMTGTAKAGGLGEAAFEATREARAGDAPEGTAGTDTKPAAPTKAESKPSGAAPAVPDDGRPKAPKIDPALEPYRELFADRCGAFVVCPDEARALIALAVFRTKYELRTAIVSTQDVRFLIDKYRAAGVALSPTAGSIREEEGVLVNPAEIGARNKVPVVFRSGTTGDPRNLYGIADLAVHHGVDPEDALRMITRQPARFLGVLDRVGSLERGKDADLVILSGEPFAAGTAILRTMVDGRFADEEVAR